MNRLINRSDGVYHPTKNGDKDDIRITVNVQAGLTCQRSQRYIQNRYPVSVHCRHYLSFIQSLAGNAVEHHFLEYYNRELTFLREMAQEFAAKHPQIAGRLGIEGAGIADPYVERLIEAFCFLSARTQMKLDAGFPVLTQRLLDIVCPDYNSPTPSMGVIQLTPDPQAGDVSRGYTVPRHSVIRSQRHPGNPARCEFRNSQPVTLWPLRLTEASLSAELPLLPASANATIDISQCKGTLRLKLALTGEQTFPGLHGLESLPFYLQGDEHIVSQLFELIHRHFVAMYISPTHPEQDIRLAGREALSFEGLSPEHSLLPLHWNKFHGHTLLQEYLCFRQRFYFFTLSRLAEGLQNISGHQAEIVILLSELPEHLIAHTHAGHFLLFCTPVINLFPKQLDQTVINRAQNSFHLVTDRCNPLDYEIFSVSNVSGMNDKNSHEITFNPLYQNRHRTRQEAGRYFSLERKPTLPGLNEHPSALNYQGTELFLSLVDQYDAPYSDDLRYLRVEAMVTNRDLPRKLCGTVGDKLMLPEAVPVSGAKFVVPLSAPKAPFASGESAWQLIRQLSLNYLPLTDMSGQAGAEALRDILHLFTCGTDPQATARINSLVECRAEAVVRRLDGEGLLTYGRGVRCSLTIDEDGFSGCSPYLFGMIMENYLSRHAAINVFTETWLYSVQRGCIGQWQARPGRRGIL